MYRDDEDEKHSSDDNMDYDDNEDYKFKEYHSNYKQCPYTKMSCPMMQMQNPMMQSPHMCPMMGTDTSDYHMQPYMHRQGGHYNKPQYHHPYHHGYENEYDYEYNHGYYPGHGIPTPYFNPYYFNYLPWFLMSGRNESET
jgi:hypothetical protein